MRCYSVRIHRLYCHRVLPSSFPIKTVPPDAGGAVWNVLPKDAHGNADVGDVLTTEIKNTVVHATNRLVRLVRVENLFVVQTPDAV
jgi:mannose-1-phosphate guanylyltransferase/mannose-6-phosphate isomerase